MFKKIKEKKKLNNFQKEIDLAVGNTMEKFGEANAQHFKANTDLKKISESKINPDYSKTNLQQQAGFSAEVKQTARTNADNILNDKPQRIKRTDDVGDVNHPKYDHVEVDSNGNPVKDLQGNYLTGSQQKNFSKVGNYDKLYQKEYEHYKDTPIDVPSDQYEQIKQRWDEQKEKLLEQEKRLRQDGNNQKANLIKEKIDKIDDTEKRLRKSKVSAKDAMEARKHHKISTAKDIGRISHKAGVKAAKSGAVIGGVVSGVQNTKKILDGEKEIKEAAFDVVTDTGKAAIKSYATAASSAAMGGALKASSKQVLQNLAKKNSPTAIVATATILAKQTYKLASGDITPEKYAENIGKEGFALASSLTGANLGAIVGTAIFPGVGTVIGGFVGGMVSSMLSGAVHAELLKTINDTKLSDEKRQLMSEYCKKLKEEEILYREEMIATFNMFFDEKENELKSGFEKISEAISAGNDISSGLEIVASVFNFELAFLSKEEFSKHLKKNKVLEL